MILSIHCLTMRKLVDLVTVVIDCFYFVAFYLSFALLVISDISGLYLENNGVHFKHICTYCKRIKQELLLPEHLTSTNNIWTPHPLVLHIFQL